jgi:hypothetical protein
VVSGAGSNGGGIYNDAGSDLVVKNVDIVGNQAGDSGGGIFNASTNDVEVIVGRILSNTAANLGGGVVNSGTLIIDGSQLVSNTAQTGSSGGLANLNASRVTISGTAILSNTAQTVAGGLNNLGNLIVIASSIRYNTAGNGGGLNNTGAAQLTNSTVGNNRTTADGGGLVNNGTLTLTNVTISGNQTSLGVGAGINNLGGVVQLTNASIVSNTSPASGGGLKLGGGMVILTNTLLAYNEPDNCGTGLGNATSNGYNLSSDATCDIASTGDLTDTNPMLGPLQNNGGSTWTHALLFTSPAIDRGTDDGCPATDQRGVARPHGAACDIGAYEYNGVIRKVYLPLLMKNF